MLMNIIKIIITGVLLVLACSARAQEDHHTDSSSRQQLVGDTTTYLDSTAYDSSYLYYDNIDDDEETLAETPMVNDSIRVNLREADEAVIDQLHEDGELQYDADTPVVWSVWDRFQMWLSNLINSLFIWGEYTDWGQFFMFLFIIIVLAFVILRLLRVDALKMFYGASKAQVSNYVVLDENIHEMDFDKLIQEALQKKEHRVAIRLTFLQGLKMLADHHHIYWEPGKTNQDYMNELKTTNLKKGFAQLNYYFEYAWYGNFNVSHDTFKHVRDLYNSWKNNIR